MGVVIRELPLYPEVPVSAVEAETGLARDTSCVRCALSGRKLTDEDRKHIRIPKSVCIGDDGKRGGVLFVGEAPIRTDDDRGRPMVGDSGEYLRKLVAETYTGPVAYSYAVRCHPMREQLSEDHVNACRGYLATTIEDVNPERIIALGSWSAYSVLGRSVYPAGHRGGYAYLMSRYARPIPVFYLIPPAHALRNRFLREWFKEDLKHALTRERPQPPPIDEVVRVVETAEDARAAVADARAAAWSAIDIESAGVLFDESFRLLCLSIAPMRGNGDESPWGWDEEGLVRPETRGPLEEYLAEEASKKRGQNVSFDVNGLKTTRFRVNGIEADIRLWRKLLDVEAPADLESIMELVGMGGGKEEQQESEKPAVDRIKFGVQTERRLAKAAREGKRVGKLAPKTKESLDALNDLDERLPHIAALARDPDIEPGAWAKAVVPVDLLLRYNGRDGVSTARAGVKLEADVIACPPVNRIRTMVVDRAAHAAQRVEEWGVPVDMDALRRFDSYCMLKISAAKSALSQMVGPDFNPGSHPQVRELLFEKLRLSSWKQTKKGAASTDEEALAGLKGKHPIVDQILVFREFDKLQSNYAGGMIPWVRADGRVHPSILLDGAKSGRASIKKPAMQTLPSPKRDPEMGVMARDVFATTPGRTLIQLDFKQVEWRVAAMLSKDPIMIADIVAGRDPHWETARAISRVAWNISPDAVTEQHRALVKPVNFGVLYGKGVGTLAKDLGCSKEQAEAILNAILGRYSKLARWIKNNLRSAQKTGYVHTWWAGEQARRRPMFDLDSKEDARRKHAENGTTNNPIQGTANEFQVASLVQCVEWIEAEGLDEDVKLVLPVHDSLLFDVADYMVPEVVAMARGIMTGHDSDGVPLDVDVESGRSWGSLTKYVEKKAA